jgi:hypothetical protein
MPRPLNFHNLDSVSEGHRLMTFVLADMGGMMPIGGNSVLDNLQQLLKTPPTRE